MKHKKIVASLLITSLIITSAGFSTLAATIESVAKTSAKKFSEERIKLPSQYSYLLDFVCGRYLMGNDDIDDTIKEEMPTKEASISDAEFDDENDNIKNDAKTTYEEEPEEGVPDSGDNQDDSSIMNKDDDNDDAEQND